jgi:hypothetical protein
MVKHVPELHSCSGQVLVLLLLYLSRNRFTEAFEGRSD